MKKRIICKHVCDNGCTAYFKDGVRTGRHWIKRRNGKGDSKGQT